MFTVLDQFKCSCVYSGKLANYSLRQILSPTPIIETSTCQTVTTLANCSRIQLNVKKKYTGDVEEEETSNPLTGRLALEAVKLRANGGGKGHQSPTIQL